MVGPEGTARPSSFAAGIACRCPRCGCGRLYDGVLSVAEACAACGLDLRPHDTGDGPAVFVILILGALVTGGALWLETALTPPIWLHMIIWPPVIVVLAIAMLRPMKAILVALHFKTLPHEYDGTG